MGTIRAVIRWFIRGVGAAVLGAVLGFAALHSAAGRRLIARGLERALSASGYIARIEGIRWDLPAVLTASSVSISDAAGEWALATNVWCRARWRGGALEIQGVAQALAIRRKPEPPRKRPQEPVRETPFAKFALVGQWTVGTVTLPGAVVRSAGFVLWQSEEAWSAAVQLWSRAPLWTALRAEVERRMSEPEIRCQITAKDETGDFVSRFVGTNRPATMFIRFAGPLHAVEGELVGDVSGWLAGKVQVSADLVEGVRATMHLAAQNAGALPSAFESLALTASVTGRLSALSAWLDGEVQAYGERFAFKGPAQLERDALSAHDVRVVVRNAEASGAFAWAIREKRIEAGGLGRVPSLAAWADRWPDLGEGQLSAEVHLSMSNGIGVFTANGVLEDWRTTRTAVSQVVARVNWAIGKGAGAELNLTATHALWGPVNVRQVRFGAAGEPGAFDWDLEFEADAGGLAYLRARGDFRQINDVNALRLADARGAWANQPFQLMRPVRLSWTRSDWDCEPLEWTSGESLLRCQARVISNEFHGAMEIERWPIALPQLTATGTGALQVNGPLTNPAVMAQLRLNDIRTPQLPAAIFDRMNAELFAQYREGLATVTASVQGAQGWLANGVYAVPAECSLHPWIVRLRGETPARGKVRVEADFGRIFPPDQLPEQAIGGQLALELALEGRADAPRIEGALTLQNGFYENYALGTVLSNLQFQARTQENRLELVSAEATDGRAGRYQANGHILLSPTRYFPYDLSISFRNARLVNQDFLNIIADGTTRLSGSLTRGKLAGDVELQLLEYLSIEQPSRDIPKLEVVEIPERTQRESEPSPAAPVYPLDLDLTLKTPGRVLIRGRGLDSEWRGAVHITGTWDEPRFVGTLTAVRGTLLFLGKRFRLTQAELTFDGRVPADPLVNIVAEAQAADVHAELTLKGFWSMPEWELRSDPMLPPDEIMARLLFGRSLDRISPFQAARIAHGLNVLRGTGSAFDLIERSQRILRVDQLEFRPGEQDLRSSSIVVGKYVGERLYVEGEKSVAGPTARIQLDVEVSRSLQLQTESSPGIREGVYLKWSRDY